MEYQYQMLNLAMGTIIAVCLLLTVILVSSRNHRLEKVSKKYDNLKVMYNSLRSYIQTVVKGHCLVLSKGSEYVNCRLTTFLILRAYEEIMQHCRVVCVIEGGNKITLEVGHLPDVVTERVRESFFVLEVHGILFDSTYTDDRVNINKLAIEEYWYSSRPHIIRVLK